MYPSSFTLLFALLLLSFTQSSAFAGDPPQKNIFASNGTLGSNAFFTFYTPLEVSIPNRLRLQSALSHDWTKKGDQTQTLDFQVEYPFGNGKKTYASLQIEGLIEKYRFSNKTAKDWGVPQPKGIHGGDIIVHAKFLLLDTQKSLTVLNIKLKTATGLAQNFRFSDGTGFSTYLSAATRVLDQSNLELILSAMAGFAAWDDTFRVNLNPSEVATSQDDLFHFGASANLRTKDQKKSVTVGLMGAEGYRNNGDQVLAPYLEFRTRVGQNIDLFQRSQAISNYNFKNIRPDDIRLSLGASVLVGKVKSPKAKLYTPLQSASVF